MDLNFKNAIFELSLANARFSYDVWGNLRDPLDWDNTLPEDNKEMFRILDRGFTGHEHLDEFDYINMNGRIYDQILGQFIHPDQNIKFSGEFISLNRKTVLF